MAVSLNTFVTLKSHKLQAQKTHYETTPIVQTYVDEYVDAVDIIQERVQESMFYQQIMGKTVVVIAYDKNNKKLRSGSGVILDSAQGTVLTAHHVVIGADRIVVKTNDGLEFSRFKRHVGQISTVSDEDATVLSGMHNLMFPPHSPHYAPMDPRPGIKRKMQRQYAEQQRQQQDKKQQEQKGQTLEAGIFDLPHDLLFGKKKNKSVTPKKPKVDDKRGIGMTVIPYGNADLAVLYFKMDLKAQSAVFATNEPKIGDDIYVCGSPYGETFFNTITKGILSGKGRRTGRLGKISLYQTDAAVLPGNSGGPWFNSNGELVAISTSWVPSSGTVGLGIPLSELLKIRER